MYNWLRFPVAFSALLFIATLQSCHKDEPAIDYDLTSNCFSNFLYVRTINNVAATVIDNGSDSSVYGIQLTIPLQVDNQKIQLLSACNLPDRLKKVGQQLIISGRLMNYNERIPWYYIFGQPFVLTAIKTK